MAWIQNHFGMKREPDDSSDTGILNHFFPNEYPKVDVDSQGETYRCDVYDLSPAEVGIAAPEVNLSSPLHKTKKK